MSNHIHIRQERIVRMDKTKILLEKKFFLAFDLIL